jgi:hypothetical protein
MVLLACMATPPLLCQEPLPVQLSLVNFEQTDAVDLDYAWRFAPGDVQGSESTSCDDSRWAPVRPALTSADPLSDRWSGLGWFRRHLEIEPGLQGRTLELRFVSLGSARVFLDGHRVLSVGEDETPSGFPAARSDAVLIHLSGRTHLLAVRYVYQRLAPRPRSGFGFSLSLSNHPGVPPSGEWLVGFRGAIVALPAILALLHFALFSFDRHAKENLFYALEMLTLSVIVLREYRAVLLPSGAPREMADHLGQGMPIVAIVFGLFTYYALRTHPWPKSWQAFAAAALVLFPLSWAASNVVEYAWSAYFLAGVGEVIRLERGSATIERKGARFFLSSLAIFGLTIVLQILINFQVLNSVGGLREVYVLGIVASAVGMSLYLASSLGKSRIDAAENARKTQELARARALQLSMLPAGMPRLPGLDVAAVTQTATEVGGDYYDARFAGDGALLFAFGDASGHGLAAGVVVIAAKALFSALAPNDSPLQMLASCDRAMAAMNLPARHHMCLSLARVSPRRVTIASAAMPPLLVCRAANGAIEEVGAGALPLGGRLPARYEEQAVDLSGGDTLLFASDGFAELTDPEGRLLGYDGVTAALRRAAHAATAAEVVRRLLAEATAFRATYPQGDDVSFLAIRVENELP